MDPRGMNPLYHLCHMLLRPILGTFFKFQILGVENVPRTGGVLLMSNHVSFIDPMYIGTAVYRSLYYMARSTLFRPEPIRRFLMEVNAFPVHQGVPDRRAIRWALQLLADGNQLAIFPEGTRSVDGTLGEAQPGVGLIAYRTSAPVVPVFLNGAQNALPRGAKMPKPAKVTILFGKPLDMDSHRKNRASRETYVRIGEDVMAEIAKLKSRFTS